jgi:hypothetical protein
VITTSAWQPLASAARLVSRIFSAGWHDPVSGDALVGVCMTLRRAPDEHFDRRRPSTSLYTRGVRIMFTRFEHGAPKVIVR